MIESQTKAETTVVEKKRRILEAALTLFVTKGYAGTSMGRIAVAARVPKSLIFHHFTDKQTLWRKVKAYLFDRCLPDPNEVIPTDKGLRAFLETIILRRYHVYENNPEMRRMIAWQALEDEATELLGGTHHSPTEWIKQIETLQQQGDIRTDENAKLIMVNIVAALMPLTTTYVRGLFKTKHEKDSYIQMIIDNLQLALQPQ